MNSTAPDESLFTTDKLSEDVLGQPLVINHETQDPIAEVELTDLGFPVGHIIDLADGRPAGFEPVGEAVRLSITVGLGETRLLHLLPGETHEAR